MSTRQDGPALAGGQDTSTNTIRPVPIDHATGAVLVTGSGGSGGSVTQGTSPWVVGQASAGALNATVVGTGTFATQATLSAGTNVIGGVRRAGFQNAVWTTSHFPAANTQATITKASAGGGVKNVALGFTAAIVATASAPTAVQLNVKLIDGASGGGTILWGTVISLPAVAGASVIVIRSGIYIPGTANTAMTLEFSATGGASTVESVSLEGTTE